MVYNPARVSPQPLVQISVSGSLIQSQLRSDDTEALTVICVCIYP